MKYNAKKVSRAIDERRASWNGEKSFYEALNQGGLNFLNFQYVPENFEWNSETSLENFIHLWKHFLYDVTLSQTTVSDGDIILVKGTVGTTGEVLNNKLSKVLYVENAKDSSKIAVTNIANGKIETLNTKRREDRNLFTILRFSKLGPNLLSYQKILFNYLLKMNQHILGSLILLCCPEVMTQSGKPRKNTSKSFFSYFSCEQLQKIIKELKEPTLNKIDNSCFISNLLNETENQGLSLPFDQGKKDEIIREYGSLNRFKTAANNFLHGTASEKIYKYFEDEQNKRQFQERFSCILQLYLLLSPADISYTRPVSPESFDGDSDNSITEYVTLSQTQFTLATNVIRYFSDNKENSVIQVQSLFSLAGYVFESIRPKKSRVNSIADEFDQYKEKILCFGEGRLDFYFALRRYKSVNHFAAEKLSEIYYFGRTFEGYEVEINIPKSIEMLNSCEDNSVSARWSLGENYMRLSEQNNSNQQENLEKARVLFENCDEYPPALNSQARLLMRKIKERDENPIPEDKATQTVVKAIELASRSAKYGWVYAFNNLYAWLSDEMIIKYLDNKAGEDVREQAYSLLEPPSEEESNKPPRRKRENEMSSVMRKLSSGITKEVENYCGDKSKITFKYRTPIKNNPVNFLVVSAYYDNLYAINHLGLELVKEDRNTAKLLFEYAAVYGEWGYRNLARNIYSNRMMKKLLEEKADEMKEKTDRWRKVNPSIQFLEPCDESQDTKKST